MKPINESTPLLIKMQRLFYIIPPDESMFETLDEVPDYVGESFAGFMVLMLIELVLLWYQQRPMPRINDAMSSVGAGILSRIPSLVLTRAIEMVTYTYVWDNYRLTELPWNSYWTWILAMLGVDLGYYWVHRCAHEINFMWAAHQMHHSSEDYNLSTALRQSVLQSYSSWMFYLPLALCIPPPMYEVHRQFNLLYQFWIHTEVVGWLGPLEYIINTPSAHRVHHGRNRYCIDKNYAGTFTFYDIIFGTYERERRDKPEEKVVYGLVHPLQSSNPIYAQLCQWQHILVSAWNRPGIGNKVKTFLYGPGWDAGKPRLGYRTDIPDIKYPQPKYETPVPLWYTVYAIVHFLPVVTIHILAHATLKSLSQLHVLLSIAFIIVSLTCIGSLFDQRWYAPYTEMVRCAAVTAYLFTQTHFMVLPLILLFGTSTCVFALATYRHWTAAGCSVKTE